jgi:hypothetical protein
MNSFDIIFDIDGTLADVSHRQHFLRRTPKDWAAFQAAAHLDPPHEPIVRLARTLTLVGHRIVLCSGRGEQERPVTEEWLDRHAIAHHGIYMRTEGDYRDDAIIKAELYERILADGFSPALVFDDRNRVVRLWRSLGLTCCQVADGDF